MPERVRVVAEHHEGKGPKGTFVLGDPTQPNTKLDSIVGQVKSIYLDPPYLTGSRFTMRVRVGEKEWKSGHGSLVLDTFSDSKDRASFLEMMREVLTTCHRLLREDGMLFVHIDYRAHPHLRLMLDEIFGESNFINEIIWVYQTGGRSTRHFSRKHDIILLYAKSPEYDFHMDEVMITPTEPRSNHMRRHVDPDGRIYRSIKANGRVYTYYDDDPIAPSDVWSDLSHLQQKDPERTGYDTQKPLSLLRRVVCCSSREGELVADLFCGSGTTLEASRITRRDFFGMDKCGLTPNILRRRLDGSTYTLELPAWEGEADCGFETTTGVGFYHVRLQSFSVPSERSFEGLDAVDGWSVGYLREDGYHVMDRFDRTRREPALKTELTLPIYEGTPAMSVNDVYGHSYYYTLDV